MIGTLVDCILWFLLGVYTSRAIIHFPKYGTKRFLDANQPLRFFFYSLFFSVIAIVPLVCLIM